MYRRKSLEVVGGIGLVLFATISEVKGQACQDCPDVAAIACGAVFGTLAVIGIIALTVFFCRRKKAKDRAKAENQKKGRAALNSHANPGFIGDAEAGQAGPKDATLKPRLCVLKRWPEDTSYGFDLKASKTQRGHFIHSVDPDSSAKSAGLKVGDKIIEVNKQPILEDSHQDVVKRIKLVPTEVEFLVADAATMERYESKGVEITGRLPEVVVLRSPATKPSAGSSAFPNYTPCREYDGNQNRK